jgi:hypothetical protein
MLLSPRSPTAESSFLVKRAMSGIPRSERYLRLVAAAKAGGRYLKQFSQSDN